MAPNVLKRAPNQSVRRRLPEKAGQAGQRPSRWVIKMTDSQNSAPKAKKFWLVAIGLLGFVLSNFSTPFIFLKMRPT